MKRLTKTALGLACTSLLAGPPYLTDDPEPVDLHHWEVYLFAMGQSVGGVRSGLAPAMEANYGPFEDAQIQFQIPMAYGLGDDGLNHRGFGDLQMGFKYRFVHESDLLPQIAVYPQIQAPTGRLDEGLGSGHVRVYLPVWLQKAFGKWTTYGGGGWMRNPGPNNRDYATCGWQLQRELGEGYSVGGEIFHQGATCLGARATTSWNLGFECQLVDHLQVVGSGGRTFRGEPGSQYYLGLRGKF
ncbi:MAG TPA: transporter [Geothrix sp.]|nr:transporter [Geothrix sp.]